MCEYTRLLFDHGLTESQKQMGLTWLIVVVVHWAEYEGNQRSVLQPSTRRRQSVVDGKHLNEDGGDSELAEYRELRHLDSCVKQTPWLVCRVRIKLRVDFGLSKLTRPRA